MHMNQKYIGVSMPMFDGERKHKSFNSGLAAQKEVLGNFGANLFRLFLLLWEQSIEVHKQKIVNGSNAGPGIRTQAESLRRLSLK